jgi:cytidylate kinase
MEGRDIWNCCFPQRRVVKIFLEAAAGVAPRTPAGKGTHQEKGEVWDLAQVIFLMNVRGTRTNADTRAHGSSPLVRASDAVLVDQLRD